MTDELDEPIKGAAKDAIGALVKSAQNDPKMQEAGANTAASLATITGFVRRLLLPLAAANYGIDKAQNYFKTRFASDLAAKVRDIPEDNLVEPKAFIAAPALQALAFSFEEKELREMYLSLLARSMDSRSNTHPSHVDVIRQLAPEEARLLKQILKMEQWPIIQVRRNTSANGYTTKARHLMNLTNPDTNEYYDNEQISMYVENWMRLGLVSVDYTSYLMKVDKYYSWESSHPKYLEIKNIIDTEGNPNVSVSIEHGILTRTDFGVSFCKVVDIPDEEPHEDEE